MLELSGQASSAAESAGTSRTAPAGPPRLSLPTSVRRGERLAAALAAVSLIGLVGISLLVVVAAAERPSFLTPISRPRFFPAWMVGPLGGLWPQLTSNYDTLAWLVSAAMGVMYVLYVIAFTTVWRLRARWTVGAVLALHAIFLLAPPLSYTDVFNYVNYGRMGVVHHLNPYATIPLLEPHGDPSYQLSNWHRLLSPYGPLFTLFTYALVPLGVSASLWALKLILAAASLATLALVWKCAELLRRSPTSAIVLVGANPIVLIWGLGADHNDVLMALPVMLATYLLLRVPRSARGSGALLVTGAFVKASAAVLFPIFLLAGHPRSFLRGAVVAATLLGLASVIAFGLHLPGLSTQSHLVTGLGLPNLIGLALGQGGETATLRTLISLSLLLTIAGCTVWVARRPADWITASAVVLLALIGSLSWLAPWYLLWVLPFAALSGARRLRRFVIAVGAYLILAFVPAAPMLAEAIHFRPNAGSLGMSHRREIEELVR